MRFVGEADFLLTNSGSAPGLFQYPEPQSGCVKKIMTPPLVERG